MRLTELIENYKCVCGFAGSTLSVKSQIPLYSQLQQLIKKALLSGNIHVDDAIPPERELAADLGISRVTVRSAAW